MDDGEKAFIQRYAAHLGNLIHQGGHTSSEVRELLAPLTADLDAETLLEAGVSPSNRQHIAKAMEYHFKQKGSR